ncbi:focadhesin-like [Uranotaenia lowii]|uniref:focadhesin-like n=1 Tax=Uranotaenia lowii TaxID=190385 RepID=UPI00247865CE|nr:focadhesin-like [Uranotaenia lowii]XP_055610062.1 focadhesin-like [Uranotaenia lowii]
MDDLKQIVSKQNSLATACALSKALQTIAEEAKQKSDGKTSFSPVTNQINLLKNLCKSENPHTSQLAVQALVQLVENGTADLGQALGILVTALAHSTAVQFIALANGMFDLLLLDLRRRCIALGTEKYVCQFDIKHPQHPLILLLLEKKDIVNVLFFAGKLHSVCNHHDQIIRDNSIEFLRPVILFQFNNVNVPTETHKIWSTLVKTAQNNSKAENLIYEVFSWSKSTSLEQCLYTNSLLLEILDSLPVDNRFAGLRGDCCLYLAAITKDLINYNIDPQENFLKILSSLHALENFYEFDDAVLLMLMADILEILSPVYIREAMRIIRLLLKSAPHRLSLAMISDAVIQLLAQQTFVKSYLEDCDFILRHIAEINDENFAAQNKPVRSIVYFHNDLSKYKHLSLGWIAIEQGINSIDTFLNHIELNLRFADKISLVLRAMLHFKNLNFTDWKRVFEQLIRLAKCNEDASARIISPVLYFLANETNMHKKLLILQNLASLGAKDHVLGVLNALAKDIDRATCFDLFLRLWKAEPRTYPFLYDLLKDTKARSQDDPWETTLARTYTIREVCLIKPQQHGADLVNLFSEILSNAEDANNEAAIALALDSIASLCENHVVNIVSTWKVLGFKFTDEKRPRIIRGLCRFFANVPTIKVTSLEQEKLVNEIIIKLWQFVTDFDDGEVIIAALEALKAFPPEMMTIFQIPSIFRGDIKLPDPEDESLEAKQIPGECWVYLIKYVHYSALEAAGNLVIHHIANEMQTYRGGVFLTPEGRPEPSSLKYLPKKSILSSIVNFLISESKKLNRCEGNEQFLKNLLNIIAHKYPKPIPPLDWCFLLDYIHVCFEMRRPCLQISIKQMPVSGSAKRLVENYMVVLIDGVMEAEDVLVFYENLEIVTESASNDLYKRFIHLSLKYLIELAEDGDQSFALVTKYLKAAIVKSYENGENVEYLYETIDNMFSRFDLNSECFYQYLEVFSSLPEKYQQSMLKPSEWIDKKNLHKLKKTIRFSFFEPKDGNSQRASTFAGLGDILKTICHLGEEPEAKATQRYFFQTFMNFIPSLHKKSFLSSDWLLELIYCIQSTLSEQECRKKSEILFAVDVFMLAVISFSGWCCFVSPDAVIDHVDKRLFVFPTALASIFQQNLWRDVENKIYEFLYHLYNHSQIPLHYAECFRYALISCKEQSYFQQPKVWSKFVSMRKV